MTEILLENKPKPSVFENSLAISSLTSAMKSLELSTIINPTAPSVPFKILILGELVWRNCTSS